MTRARTASTQRSKSIVTDLNPQQRAAAEHGDLPLLIVAGAGTGKTKTLVHRVARLIDRGVPPGRILLLTFTRRAAAEMLRRVEGLLGRSTGGGRVWGGTFHSIASRLLRHHGKAIGLDPSFTIHDRSDSEDLLDLVRSELELGNHAADGNIPSDMATKSDEQIEEERRLFYVALTRAENRLCVCWPLRYFHAYRGPRSDQHGYAQLTRFISEDAKRCFDCRPAVTGQKDNQQPVMTTADARRKLRAMWQ